MALGGLQTYTFSLLKHLGSRADVHLAYNNPGDFLSVMQTAAPCHWLRVPIRPREYQRRPWRLGRSMWALNRLIGELSAHALVTGSGLGSIQGGVVARRRRIPHARIVGGAPSQIETRLYANYERLAIDRLIDRYFGWEAVFDELQAVGVDRAKMTLTPPAVDVSLFRPPTASERRAARDELGVATNATVIGWSGRIAENMQVKWTVQLAAELAHRGVGPLHLLLVGGGDWVRELRARVDAAGLTERTTFLGWRPYERMPSYYHAMDIVPLLAPDPQGGSILREAMACGLPVVTVDGESGAQRDFIEHLTNGILVHPDGFVSTAADWVQRLLDEPKLAQALGREAARYATAHMSFDRVAALVADWAETTVEPA